MSRLDHDSIAADGVQLLASCKAKLLIVVWQLQRVMGNLGNFMSSRANEACFPKDLFHEVGFSGG